MGYPSGCRWQRGERGQRVPAYRLVAWVWLKGCRGERDHLEGHFGAGWLGLPVLPLGSHVHLSFSDK